MPCAACYGTCVVCQGLVPHGPTELPPGDSEAELRQETEVAARAADEPQRAGFGPPVRTEHPEAVITGGTEVAARAVEEPQRAGLGPPVHTVQPVADPPAVAVEVEVEAQTEERPRRRRRRFLRWM